MLASASQVIGRDEELDSLRRFLDAVPEAPVALVIEGEAGIGKTALWLQGADLARQMSFRILACRPAASETRLSFAALDDLLAGVLDEALPGLAEPRRRALEIALLRAAAEGPPPDQRVVSRAALDVVRLLAAKTPVILAIDDVQWLDAPSARVMEFVARRLEISPVGVLVSRRAGTEGGMLSVVLWCWRCSACLPGHKARHGPCSWPGPGHRIAGDTHGEHLRVGHPRHLRLAAAQHSSFPVAGAQISCTNTTYTLTRSAYNQWFHHRWWLCW
jgi:hypothetical protein